MPFQTEAILFFLIFLLSVGLTQLVRHYAQRFGFISKPAVGRWNSRVVALGGGIAIHASVMAGMFFLGGDCVAVVFPGYFLVFLLGFVDDIISIPPSGKLVIQVVAATLIVSSGSLLPMPWPVVSISFTLVWLVGMSNAVNLIDNMDGLAAGFGFIAALGLSYLLASQGSLPESRLALVLGAASLGFLIFNWHPAKIFMGDAGSLPLGFLLSVLSTKLVFQSQNPNWLTLLPLCFLFIVPLFDTTLVMIARKGARRPIMSGGRDHTSHRLVELGLSEPRAVLVLYLFGIVGFLIALALIQTVLSTMVLVAVASFIAITLLIIFLLEIVVYPVPPAEVFTSKFRPEKALQGMNTLPMPALYIVELIIDIFTISFSWATAHYLRFADSGVLSQYEVLTVIPSLPYVIVAKLIAISIFRLHRGVWRSIGNRDVYQIFKASSLGTIFVVVFLALKTQMQDISRLVIIIDWLMTFMIILATRGAISAFRRWSRKLAVSSFRAAFLGSPGLSSAVRQALKQESGLVFAGTISPDGDEKAQPGILGAGQNLESLVKEHAIDVLLVGTEGFEDKIEVLASHGILIRHVKIAFT